MNYGVILAGGASQRFGGEVPKQFVELAGKPLLLWSVSVFSKIESFQKLIVVLPEKWLDVGKKIVLSQLQDNRLRFIAGGATRTESLLNALRHIEENYGVKDEDIAVTHDAARPFVKEEHILASIRACQELPAVTLALRAVDTVAISRDDRIVSLTDRSKTFLVQTPQTFKIKVFLELFERLTMEQRSSLTDATGVFIMNKEPVGIVEGDPCNIKVTTQLDFTLAEAIAKISSK